MAKTLSWTHEAPVVAGDYRCRGLGAVVTRVTVVELEDGELYVPCRDLELAAAGGLVSVGDMSCEWLGPLGDCDEPA